jgi:hypothetical protein
MSPGNSGGPLVCGFSDMASGLGGLAWDLAGGGGLLLSDGEVADAEPEISADEKMANVRLTSGKLSVEAELVFHTAPIGLDPAGGGTPQVQAATCTATIEADGRKLQCPGHLSRWDGDPVDGAGTFRHLAIEAADGSLILLVAQGLAGASGHGEEQTAGWALDPEGAATAFGEALLSTQYDAGGNPTRLGLELWPEGEEQTVRAAATRPSATRLGGAEHAGMTAALFRSHVDGTDGLASYLLWRA